MNATTVMPERPRRRGLVGPAILIGLGVVFLLNNLGVLGWEVWETLVRLWPVLLIAVGLDLLIGQRSALGSLLVVALLLGALALAVWYSGTWWGAASAPLAGDTIRQPLGEAERANVSLKIGAGSLQINALTDSSDLVAGTIAHDPRERIARAFSMSGDTASFELRSIGWPGWMPRFGERRAIEPLWDLRLNDDVPLHLDIAAGAGSATLDLSQLKVGELKVTSGVGTTTLTLPRHGDLSARINGGVGQTTVTIPAGLAARITATTGLGQVRVVGDFQRQGQTYVSRGYDEAENRVDLVVNGGIGSIAIQQESGR